MMEFSEQVIPMLNDIYALMLWKDRDARIDQDLDRMRNDYLDARRIIGCKLADEIMENCNTENAVCRDMPEHYFPYLCSISLMEFKEMKAYFLWAEKYGRAHVSEKIKRQIFLEACDKIENSCINCSNKINRKIPKHILNFLIYSKKTQYHNMIKRKAYWNGAYEQSSDPYYNWKKAETFVKAIYDPFETSTELTKDEVISIIDTIEKNHHLILI